MPKQKNISERLIKHLGNKPTCGTVITNITSGEDSKVPQPESVDPFVEMHTPIDLRGCGNGLDMVANMRRILYDSDAARLHAYVAVTAAQFTEIDRLCVKDIDTAEALKKRATLFGYYIVVLL